MLQDIPTPVRKVSDGLSKTFMFFESAGRPYLYNQSRAQIGVMYEAPNTRAKPGEGTVGKGTDYQWADDRTYALWGNAPSTTGCGVTTIMNCDNYAEIYSFHNGGANILFGDGSVNLINENTDVDTFVSLITSSADDVAGTY